MKNIILALALCLNANAQAEVYAQKVYLGTSDILGILKKECTHKKVPTSDHARFSECLADSDVPTKFFSDRYQSNKTDVELCNSIGGSLVSEYCITQTNN